MKQIVIGCVLLVGSLPAFAAISGTVVNQTTGQPAAGITVSLLRMTATGPAPAGDIQADAQGRFRIDQPVEGPTLVRATVDGVTYNKVLAPGQPSEGITLEVFNASREVKDAKVTKHMILMQPGGQTMTVNEAFMVANGGKTAWNDPNGGTLHFFVPKGATNLEVNATPPGGMSLKSPPEKSRREDVYQINFAMRPGETRIDLSYSVPYTANAPFSGQIVSGDQNTYLIVPEGVTLSGDHLTDLGPEPRTKAHIFGLQGDSFKVQLAGTVVPPSDNGGDADASGDNNGQPPVQEIMPRLYTKVQFILPIALGILALGFVLLYRMPSKEANERGRG